MVSNKFAGNTSSGYWSVRPAALNPNKETDYQQDSYQKNVPQIRIPQQSQILGSYKPLPPRSNANENVLFLFSC